LERALDSERDLSTFHYPGTNFLGPGTKIITSIYNNVQPTSDADRIARQHDVDYLLGNQFSSQADITAIKRATGTDPQSMVLKIGLRGRQFFGFDFAKPYKGFSNGEMSQLYNWGNSKINQPFKK